MSVDGLGPLLIRFGPVAIFLGAAFEGDASVILAGVAAHLGFVRPQAAVLAAWAGGVLGDCIWFAVGRRLRTHIRETRIYARVGAAVERLVARLGPSEIVMTRFIYGTRLASMVFWGAQGITVRKFLALDVLGCALWAAALVSVGYLSSHSAGVLLHGVGKVERGLLAALIVVALATALLRSVVRGRLTAVSRDPSHEPREE